MPPPRLAVSPSRCLADAPTRHFGGRTLDFIGERAEHYTAPDPTHALALRAQLEDMRMRELQDVPDVVENSTDWGEFQSSAVFDAALRAQLRDATRQWADDLAALIERAQEAGTADPDVSAPDAAERLSALAEGLSTRWLSGSASLERVRELLRGGIERELGAAGPAGRNSRSSRSSREA
ncbi:TetR family transcriptional regulator C-terminal domain-containing protein [Streptomyces sp. MST-110588]|uniref:TetR family transcriptional regulator C-terminal domain-containing protein n=1 Tax=Streptomyces sp. MST-110588 TaxID=2833628 RepID=UPI001F5CC613|nr:TetR family transcriptional regulator C-terminal domain-containing protein [Streptomyces sp. MST-110588]UNO40699.1 TetR family transcriptional regulator C-terminal domain-containing protein [Streptomyces sp. MST-110588]